MRRFTSVVVCLGMVAVLLGIAITASAQDDKPLLIADILKAANNPLTADQTAKLKEFKTGAGPEVFMGLSQVFNDKQNAALKETFGVQQAFGEMPESPRFLFFAIMFENEGCPFTAGQVKKIKALPDGPEAFQEMQNIFSEKQGSILQSMFNQ